MKRFLYPLLTLCLGLILGYFLGVSRDLPHIVIDFHNSSNHKISSLIVRGKNINQLLENIDQGEKRKINFPLSGESSFKLEVIFQNGARIEGGGDYAEPGYTFNVNATDSEIKSEVDLSGTY